MEEEVRERGETRKGTKHKNEVGVRKKKRQSGVEAIKSPKRDCSFNWHRVSCCISTFFTNTL